MKRTTLILDAELYAELRRRAVAGGRTLTDVVQSVIRAGLAAQPAGRRRRVQLPYYDLGPFLQDPSRRSRREDDAS